MAIRVPHIFVNEHRSVHPFFLIAAFPAKKGKAIPVIGHEVP
jgi:hypothetical protein